MSDVRTDEPSDRHLGVSAWARGCARVRMPLAAVAFLAVLVVGVLDGSTRLRVAALALLLIAILLYFRVGTPHGRTVDLHRPVAGAWTAVNSPSSRVPSHLVHAWAQTYAVDLIPESPEVPRPTFSWWPVARRPEDYPAFGTAVRAAISGVVVRARGTMRDHWGRTSPIGLVYLALECVRELFGPGMVLGNHVVIRGDDGVYALVAHLRRGSLRVGNGRHVARGDTIAECGNSGNSSEPHVHLQAMDRPGVWFGAGLPISLDGRAPPESGATHPGERQSPDIAQRAVGV